MSGLNTLWPIMYPFLRKAAACLITLHIKGNKGNRVLFELPKKHVMPMWCGAVAAGITLWCLWRVYTEPGYCPVSSLNNNPRQFLQKNKMKHLSFISRVEWYRFSSEGFNLHIKTSLPRRSVNLAHRGSDNHQSCSAQKLNDRLNSGLVARLAAHQ